MSATDTSAEAAKPREGSVGDDFKELPEVLQVELARIREGRGRGAGEPDSGPCGADKSTRMSEVVQRLHGESLVALCLSGGGIRSATFNLGVLQGLAKLGVLTEVDYLSTVSGGGYIGSWLSSWISREEGTDREKLEKVASVLGQQRGEARAKEPYQIRFLRDYSNYLTPRVGMFSIDTWTILATYLRNLLLNWLVLIPLFFAVLLVPRGMVHLVSGAFIALPGMDQALLARAMVVAGGLCAVFPIGYTVNNLPSIGDRKQSKKSFVLRFLFPLILMACFLSAYWGHVYRPGCPLPVLAEFIVFGLAVHLVGWLAGVLCYEKKQEEGKEKARRRKEVALKSGLFCAAATGAVAGCLAWLAETKLLPALLGLVVFPKLLYATVSVPLILLVYLATMASVVAFLSRRTNEQDREWWGRAAGVVMLAAVVWLTGMAVVIYGPYLLLPESTGLWKETYAAAGALWGVAAAVFGKDSATPALRPGASMSKYRTTLLSAAAVLFLIFLAQSLSLLATAASWLGAYLGQAAQDCFPLPALWFIELPRPSEPLLPLDFQTHLLILNEASFDKVLWGCGAGAFAISMVMAFVVDINKFSMHAMYRNRLIRCYLGASRDKDERDCQPFTGFDRNDDRLMTKLPLRPFHVINMAWNMVKGSRLSWQQRKAASFIMSPLFAGADIEPDPHCVEVQPGYRDISEYAAGKNRTEPMTVGTAMAISGAAASPNMGYHSSPLVTFVMAFFNVRLGWWLGNPAKGLGEVWRKRSHRFSVVPLLKETFGFTREDGRDIYLSDGGHFENLGLYEMVRRRCRYIIVCDAGCDCDTNFDDLGNAIRKVRADFQIEIELDCAALRACNMHFATGTINYACCDGGKAVNGQLLYIKPVLTGDEGVDLYNYSRMHKEFPHEATSDQWFDEAQFESYRKLGLHSLEELALPHRQELPGLFARAQRLHEEAIAGMPQREREQAGAKA